MFCWKPLVALHELGLPFERQLVEGAERTELAAIWPLARIPVLRDETMDLTVPESTTIVEHLDALAGGGRLIPADGAGALQARLWDRVLDGHVALPQQAVVFDSLRPAEERDPRGVAQSREALRAAYAVLDGRLADRAWLAGTSFTLADCSAVGALFYGWVTEPWDAERLPHLTRYCQALFARPSVDRVLEEARPYRELFPLGWPDHADALREAATAG